MPRASSDRKRTNKETTGSSEAGMSMQSQSQEVLWGDEAHSAAGKGPPTKERSMLSTLG